MKPSMLGVSTLAVVLFGPMCAMAEDAPKSSKPAAASTKADDKSGTGAAVQAKADATNADLSKADAAKADARAESRAARLTKPWRDMSSLSEDQKKQIASIHRKAVQDINAVEQRERADIMALLNDQQKTELQALADADAAERKARAGTNRPAARPAGDRTNRSAGTTSAKPDAATKSEPAGAPAK